MKSITYNAGKFLLDGNEIVNPDVLFIIGYHLVNSVWMYNTVMYGDIPVKDGEKIHLPATLRAEVEYQIIGRPNGKTWITTDKASYDRIGDKDYARKVVRLVEVEGKAEPSIKIKHDGPHQRLFSKPLPQPEKQAIDERVEEPEIQGTVIRAVASAIDTKIMRVIEKAFVAGRSKQSWESFQNEIGESSQPPPQAESQEDVAVRFAMYGSGKCTVGDQEFFRGMFRNGHWRKHEINN